MLKFEQYIQEISGSFQNTNWFEFSLNLLITAVLAGTLAWFYIKFGNSLSNRKRFARNFLPLALTTMLIITIVKSSLALSLGLVGALSIVRFRSAIKDPEELTFLFFTIGIGLAAGANQIVIAIVAFVVILIFLFVQAAINGKGVFKSTENMSVNISTSSKDMKAISDILSATFPLVELKRVDDSGDRMTISFVVEASSLAQIETARTKLMELDSASSLSFIEQRSIAV
ncbi:MAG: DUF4956 domain-containing protein [Bacteroidia bacterium]|nr:DUF4956 domain-containing protein [Bacteroidia bacterium]